MRDGRFEIICGKVGLLLKNKALVIVGVADFSSES